MSNLFDKPLPFVTEESEKSKNKTYKHLSRGLGFLFNNDQRNIVYFAVGLGVPAILISFVGLYMTAWYQFWKPKITKIVGFCSAVQGYRYTPYKKNPTVTLETGIINTANQEGKIEKVLIVTKGYHSYDKNITGKGAR